MPHMDNHLHIFTQKILVFRFVSTMLFSMGCMAFGKKAAIPGGKAALGV